jgi:hypothetical protein
MPRIGLVAHGRKLVNYTEAFATYGATLRNSQWSISAMTPEGSLVVSVFDNMLKKGDEARTLTFGGKLSTWKGNGPGRNEFQRHLTEAVEQSLLIRIVVAHPEAGQAHLVGEVQDESVIRKSFSVREDWVGSIVHFDGDEYKIVIRQQT